MFGLSPLPTDQRRIYKQSQYFICYDNFISAGVVLSQGRTKDLQKEGAKCQNWGKIGWYGPKIG